MRTRDVLPEFPRTVILPHKPNGTADDIIASNEEARVIFQSQYVHIEEKIDGASVGLGILDGHPVIRSRRNILRKGSTKGQFASLWNWWYDNREKFESLAEMGPFSIYGEWMLAEHSMKYTRLPEWLIAYDVYNYEAQRFIAPPSARKVLGELGFHMPVIRHTGEVDSYEQLDILANLPAVWAEGPAEGIYIKVYNPEIVEYRFKLVREGFIHRQDWNPQEFTKNERE